MQSTNISNIKLQFFYEINYSSLYEIKLNFYHWKVQLDPLKNAAKILIWVPLCLQNSSEDL